MFFVVSTLKECKTFDFSVFVGTSFAIAFKNGNLTMGRIGQPVALHFGRQSELISVTR